MPADRIRCRVAHARVQEAHHETLNDLIYKLFERRHHDYVAGQEKDWLTMELVQSLRRESEIYREELSTKTSGPLPFALGYFRLHGNTLRLTTGEVPANVDGRTLARLLSEFLEPGAQLWFGAENGWEIQGPDQLIALESGPQDPEDEQKN
ncbi:MAG: hypothetical protein R6T83_11645 [Salinibacter sp.]